MILSIFHRVVQSSSSPYNYIKPQNTRMTEHENNSYNWLEKLETRSDVLGKYFLIRLIGNTSSVRKKLDELEWPSLKACRDRSSMLLFHKIHCGAVAVEKDKYLTLAHNLKTTRSSHHAQYCSYQTYSDAMKIPPPPPLLGG